MKTRVTFNSLTFPVVLIFLGLVTTEVNGQITYSRTYEADWEWYDKNNNLNTGNFDHTSASSGEDNHSVSVHGSERSGFDSNVQVTSDGKIKTYISMYSESPFAGDDGFDLLDMKYRNLIHVTDILTTPVPNASFVLVLAEFHGNVAQSGNVLGGVDTYLGMMQTESIFDIFEPVGGADIFDYYSDTVQNSLNPRMISLSPSVTHSALMVFYLADGQATMNLNFEENAKMKVESLDAQGFFMEVEHDFMNTFELSANVYDVNGMLLEGVTVNSSLGHSYANFVPEPTAGALVLLFGGLMCIPRQRRRRKASGL